jgi:hypothetical protein
LDACSGCAGDYENPDLTAPGRETEDLGDAANRPETGVPEEETGDVENYGYVDFGEGPRFGRKIKKNKG